MLALVRSPEWEWALFFHVLGAFALMGAMALVTVAAIAAERSERPETTLTLRRLGLRTLLYAVVPAFILMRATAEWVRTQDAFADDETWINLGYAISDAGILVFLTLTLLAWRAVRGAARDGAARSAATRVYAALAALYLVALLVAVWAMTAKPG